ncbi:MAG TPA: hypothetical protein VFN30_11380 [Chitinophagaceae bacterium]|nr:hypothetical protein [Chitinophagaceae bacterium]
MKKHVILAAFSVILCIKSYSQIAFENGYFINESNQKINCLIRNIDWRSNPKGFEYKLSQNEAIQKATIQTVKEFGINGISKYIRAKVNIDRSSDEINSMSPDKNPNFQEETLFLKVLIEGKASLFLYIDNNLTRLFYKLNDSEISQLVYKKYLINDNIAQNDFFRQQLFMDLKCQEITLNDIKNINYEKKEIKRIFIKYNKCTNSSYITFEPTQKKDFFNLSLRPGLNYNNLTIQNTTSGSTNIDFGSKKNFRFGIETEFILPYNKNKWTIILEPTFQYFKSEKTIEVTYVSDGIIVSKVNYWSIGIPVGIRRYFFINTKSKISVNVSYIFDFSNSSNIKLSRSDGSIFRLLDIKPKGNLSLGIGYKLMDKYSIEMRYQTNRKILGDYLLWKSDYKTFSMIFGYSLF